MSWKSKFEVWISTGKTRDWLISRLDYIYINYPDQLTTGEYDEIMTLINTAYPL